MYKLRLFLMVAFMLAAFGYSDKSYAMGCHSSGDKESYEESSFKEKSAINAICPVMGGEVDKDDPIVLEYEGKRIGFCCPGCTNTFKKEPEKYMQNLEENVIDTNISLPFSKEKCR